MCGRGVLSSCSATACFGSPGVGRVELGRLYRHLEFRAARAEHGCSSPSASPSFSPPIIYRSIGTTSRDLILLFLLLTVAGALRCGSRAGSRWGPRPPAVVCSGLLHQAGGALRRHADAVVVRIRRHEAGDRRGVRCRRFDCDGMVALHFATDGWSTFFLLMAPRRGQGGSDRGAGRRTIHLRWGSQC